MANLSQKVKEKFNSVVYFFQKRGGVLASESVAIKLTAFIGVLLLVFLITNIILIIRITLPRTNLEIEISGPETVKAGELVTYNVSCKNTGNIALEDPKLIFNYPLHSFPEKGNLTEIVGPETFEGFLHPGEVKTFQFETRIFEAIGGEEEARCWLNYSTESDPAIQTSSATIFLTKISEVPLDLELDIPSKIPIFVKIKSEFKFRVRYTSLIDYSLSDLIVKIDYPSEFDLKESRPQQIGENQWKIPSLNKNETGEIELWGEFPKDQEIGQEMKFNAQLSILVQGEEISLKKTTRKALTYEPVFAITQKINSESEYVASAEEKLHYQIYFKNVSEKPLRDLILISRLEGNLYDLLTIECPEGENKSGDNSIIWSGERIPELRYLQPGGEGQVEFWVKLQSDYKPKSISEINALIRHKVSLGGFEQEFRNKVNSKLKVAQEGYYKDKYGFFENSGHPPKVNETTSYTLVWKIENYYNLMEGVEVKAPFPDQVSVKSIYNPSQGEINIIGEYLGTKPEATYPGIPDGFRFEHNLSYKMFSDEVKYLKFILKKEVPVSTRDIIGTGYFGPLTLNAVIEFQEKYKEEILFPQGLEIGTGYVDELTRLKLNELLTKGVPVTSKEIVWSLDRMDPGTGIFTEPLLAAFQIYFTPTLAQKGKIAELIGEVTLSGTDQWTGESILTKDESIDTTLPDDSSVKKGEVQ